MVKKLGVSVIRGGGRICEPVNVGAIKIFEEKTIGAIYDEFSKGTCGGEGVATNAAAGGWISQRGQLLLLVCW